MKSRIPTWTRLVTSGVIAAGLLLAAQAADPPTIKGEGAAEMETPSDAASFIKKASQANSTEIAIAEVAQRKSQNADVKQFAEMVRKDHSQLNQQLQQIAQSKGLPVDPSLDAKHQKKVESLQGLSGSEFDKEFAKGMLKSHQKSISTYEQAAQLTDPQTKQYAQNALPKLRQHLEHAKHTATAVGIDQATITSILNESGGAVGGTGDNGEQSSGSQKDKKDK